MPRFLMIMVVLLSFGSACAPSAPRLHRPDRIEAFCGDRAAISTAIESIVSSTSDQTGGATVPSPKAIRKAVQSSGGIIAHWNDQPLYLPAIAKSLGAGDGYVTLGDAAIANRPTTNPSPASDSRPIYLTLKSAAGLQTFALRAFDVQDVCNEGKLSS